jgi:phosphatidylserine decarboxylase
MDVAPSGWRYGALLAALSLPALLVTPIASLLCLVGAAGAVWFHRDPERSVPPAGVVAPADGTVSVVRREPDGRVRVGTYMSATDVHVNRAPMAGTVQRVEHSPGAHRLAFQKESERNERVTIGFEGWEVTLYAGAFARRIHPWVAPGDGVDRGGRISYVSFGSRADVVLPAGVTFGDLRVSEGDSVRAGETLLAEPASVGGRQQMDAGTGTEGPAGVDD